MEIDKVIVIFDSKAFSEMLLEEPKVLARDCPLDCEIVDMGLIHDYQHNSHLLYKYCSRCISIPHDGSSDDSGIHPSLAC